MEQKNAASFGRYLKTVRLEKGIRLSEISQQTRISKDTLELIEDEDHARLPAEVFVKGFLRAYARVVGADGDKAVEGFTESRRQMDENIQLETDVACSRSKATARMLAFLGIFGVIVIAAVITLQLLKPAATQTPTESVRAPEAVVAEGKNATVKKAAVVKADVKTIEEAAPAESATPPQAAAVPPSTQATADKPEVRPGASDPDDVTPTKQHIRIEVVENTWLKVIVDSLTTTEYSLAPGDALELDADSGFNLLVGNATGIRLQFNGKPIPVPGKSGQVVTLQLP